jgi:excisionase family DNA binding protein
VVRRLDSARDNGEGWPYGARAESEYTGLPTGQVFKLVSRGELPCRRVGQRLLFEKREVDEWLRNG